MRRVALPLTQASMRLRRYISCVAPPLGSGLGRHSLDLHTVGLTDFAAALDVLDSLDWDAALGLRSSGLCGLTGFGRYLGGEHSAGNFFMLVLGS